MRQTRLRVNLEPLWDNPRENFTVRYRDINEELKERLATKIKTLAKQYSIRKTTGPTIAKIQETLTEINPIIFSEYQREDQRWIRGHQRFGVFNTQYLAGWRFEILCQGIYQMLCLKRELRYREIINIAQLSTSDHERTVELLRPIDPNVEIERILQSTEEETFSPIEDFGIEDIARARQRAEERGAETIPSGMMEIEPIENPVNLYPAYTAEYRPRNPIRIEHGSSDLTAEEAHRRREIDRINEARRNAGQGPLRIPTEGAEVGSYA